MKRNEQGTSNAEYKGRAYLVGKRRGKIVLNVKIFQRNNRLNKLKKRAKKHTFQRGKTK